MTSANVSNVPIQMTPSAALSGKNVKSQTDANFMQMMSSNIRESATSDAQSPAVKQQTTDTTVKVETKRNEIKPAETTDTSEGVTAETKEQMDAYVEDVKEVLKEELDVTEEQLEEAMETLGLSYLDLGNQANLAGLVAELTGCENTASLLVDDGFATIVAEIGDLTQNLMEQTNLSTEQLQLIANQTMADDMTVTDVSQADAAGQTVEAEVITVDVMAEPEELTKTSQETSQTEVVVTEQRTVAEVAQETTRQTGTEEAEPVETDATLQADTSEVSRQSEMQQQKGQGEAQDEMPQNQKKQDGLHMTEQNAKMVQQPQTSQINQYHATTQEVTLSSGETVDVKHIIDQIVEAARTTISNETTTMELLLKPEGLGKILMEVSEENGRVTAHIYTQDESIKEALEQQMFQLKEQMNQSATKVQSIEVSVGTHEFEKNLEEGQQERQQEEAQQESGKRSRNINLNLNQLDELQGLMTEEEQLVAKMMRDHGNTVNFTA